MKKAYIGLIAAIIVTIVGCGGNSFYTFGTIEDSVGIDTSNMMILSRHEKTNIPKQFAVTQNTFLPKSNDSTPSIIIEQNDRKLTQDESIITESLYQDLWIAGKDTVVYFEKNDSGIFLNGHTQNGNTNKIIEKKLDISFGFMNPKTRDARSLKNALMVFDEIHNYFYICAAFEGDDSMRTYVIHPEKLTVVQIIEKTWMFEFVMLDNDGLMFFADGNLFKGNSKYPSLSSCNLYLTDDSGVFHISKDTELLEYKSGEVVRKWKFPIAIPANWLGFDDTGTPFTIKHISSGSYDLVFGVKAD